MAGRKWVTLVSTFGQIPPRTGLRRTGLLAALSLAAALVASCTVRPGVITDERLKIAAGGTPGFVLGSIGMRMAGGNRGEALINTLGVRNVDSGAGFDIVFKLDFVAASPWDIQTKEKALTVYRFPLPPGEYEIYRVEFLDSSASYQNEKNFSLPFTVEAGEAVYLGEILASSIHAKDKYGWDIRIGHRFDFSDEHERDVPVLRQHYTDLPSANPRLFLPARAIILSPPDMQIVPADVSESTSPP